MDQVRSTDGHAQRHTTKQTRETETKGGTHTGEIQGQRGKKTSSGPAQGHESYFILLHTSEKILYLLICYICL